MSVIRVGSTGKYADGWDQIFGGAGGKPGAGKVTRKGRPAKASAKQATGPKVAKKAAKKSKEKANKKAKARRR